MVLLSNRARQLFVVAVVAGSLSVVGFGATPPASARLAVVTPRSTDTSQRQLVHAPSTASPQRAGSTRTSKATRAARKRAGKRVAMVGPRVTNSRPRAASPPVSNSVISQFQSAHASIAFDPARHGFSFVNWAGSQGDDLATVSTLRRLFGDESVCKELVEEVCVVHDKVPYFVERLNAEIAKGRCEGLAALALQRFLLGLDDTASLAQSEVASDLAYWASTQILPTVRAATSRSRRSSLPEVTQYIFETLRAGEVVTLGLHGSFGDHTVVPYSVTTQRSGVVINVYDPNTPLRTSVLTVDFATSTWSYAAGESNRNSVWSGTAGGLSVVPFSARFPQPISVFASDGE